MDADADAKPVAITVCIDYADYFSHTLPINRNYFSAYYVVTEEADTATRALAEAHDCLVILTKDRRARGAKFNKAAMVRAAQERAHTEYPTSWIVVLDADILLNHPISTTGLDRAALYGMRRELYETHEDFVAKKSKRIKEITTTEPIGYFQLYCNKAVFYPGWSYNCSHCDMQFAGMFRKRILLPAAVCCHLGFVRRNWDGRVAPKW